MIELLDRWDEQRKRARVMLVIDVSGSMGDPAGRRPVPTKLDLAKQAAIDALDLFADRGRGRPARLHHQPRRAGDEEVLQLVDPADR